MPQKLNLHFYEKFGIYVRQLYGSTETGTISVDLSSDIESSLESVGKPIAGVDVEVFSENGEPTQTNGIGEIAVKSPAAIKSYGSDDVDNDAFRNGYFFTGDLGRRDQHGLLYLVGRKKMFINKGGFKINPREVEELLESHPDVEEAAVIGLATLYGDEKIKAVIVVRERCSEEEIVEFCRGKIANFKIPSIIDFTDRLPKTATGKIQRALLT
jgi:long-chain acyl-CoA synthetase